MRTALTIAGSDCSGGAGIQADIKTMAVHGVYAMSAITALTAQNTCGVTAVCEVTPDFLAAQIAAVCTDIPPDAVKVGMVASGQLAAVIAEKLAAYAVPHIVVDPVMVATSGDRLMQDSTLEILTSRLFPLAELVTPNIPEAALLTGLTIRTRQDMERAAVQMGERFGCAVLCKGGHAVQAANDVLYTKGQLHCFEGERIENPNTHGTGCTLSSAIAANLAKGHDLIEAIAQAKAYLTLQLQAGLDLGKGNGPLPHTAGLFGTCC